MAGFLKWLYVEKVGKGRRPLSVATRCSGIEDSADTASGNHQSSPSWPLLPLLRLPFLFYFF